MSLWAILVGCLLALVVRAAASPRPQDCHATAFIGTMYRDQKGTDYSIRAEIGVFADGYASPVMGELIHVTNQFDDLGCTLPWKQPTSRSWVALVRRGGCSIETKIENALRENASGIIIYSVRDSINPGRIRVSKKFQGLISVVFTYKWKGDELASLLRSGTRVISDLSIANPCVVFSTAEHERNMQLVSISFLCFIVLTISLAWLIFFYVQRYRDLQARDQKHATGLYADADEKALRAIPTKNLKANDRLVNDESECCAICIDPYRPADVVRTLICNHEFHKMCIDPWLLENRNCPMCKKDILRHYGSVFTGSQESIIQVVADEAARMGNPSTSSGPPEIQVIVVGGNGDDGDDSDSSRPPSPFPDDSNDMQILTEGAQSISIDRSPIRIHRASMLAASAREDPAEELQIVTEAPQPFQEPEIIPTVENATFVTTVTATEIPTVQPNLAVGHPQALQENQTNNGLVTPGPQNISLVSINNTLDISDELQISHESNQPQNSKEVETHPIADENVEPQPADENLDHQIIKGNEESVIPEGNDQATAFDQDINNYIPTSECNSCLVTISCDYDNVVEQPNQKEETTRILAEISPTAADISPTFAKIPPVDANVNDTTFVPSDAECYKCDQSEVQVLPDEESVPNENVPNLPIDMSRPTNIVPILSENVSPFNTGSFLESSRSVTPTTVDMAHDAIEFEEECEESTISIDDRSSIWSSDSLARNNDGTRTEECIFLDDPHEETKTYF